jgi:hypothetical protein
MATLLRLLLSLQVFTPVLRPLIRVVVGLVAIPVFRLFARRVVNPEKLNDELTKDIEQWVRGSLLLLVTTANFEYLMFGKLPPELHDFARQYAWLTLGLRLLVAVGVIEAMPDQALFAIIHPGPTKVLFPNGLRFRAVREQWWPICKGVFCRHLDRSSSVFAIMAVIFGGETHRAVGWACYGLAIIQFLIIGLVSSRDKAINVLSEFDRQVELRRQELAGEMTTAARGD